MSGRLESRPETSPHATRGRSSITTPWVVRAVPRKRRVHTSTVARAPRHQMPRWTPLARRTLDRVSACGAARFDGTRKASETKRSDELILSMVAQQSGKQEEGLGQHISAQRAAVRHSKTYRVACDAIGRARRQRRRSEARGVACDAIGRAWPQLWTSGRRLR